MYHIHLVDISSDLLDTLLEQERLPTQALAKVIKQLFGCGGSIPRKRRHPWELGAGKARAGAARAQARPARARAVPGGAYGHPSLEER